MISVISSLLIKKESTSGPSFAMAIGYPFLLSVLLLFEDVDLRFPTVALGFSCCLPVTASGPSSRYSCAYRHAAGSV